MIICGMDAHMKPFDSLEHQLENLRQQNSASLVEIRNLLLEVEEFIDSDDYRTLAPDERLRLQDARKELISTIEQRENPNDDGGQTALEEQGTDGSPPEPTGEQPVPEHETVAGPQGVHEHNPVAEQQIEVAEKLFYGGRYAEAIQIFDRVLQLEPNWERARQHRSEAENYLRTGYIPVVALPADAASAYGKAQSAARVGRYADALALLEKAQAILRDLGIQRWQEGQEFAQKLQENIDAEQVYEEGLAEFEQGQIDAAIEKVEAAVRPTGLPKYADKAKEFRQVKETLRSIHDSLSQATIDPQVVSQSKSSLDSLIAEYGHNPAFERLIERFKTVVPRVVEPLTEQTRSLKKQAERAPTLEEALYLARQAKHNLDQIRNLAGVDESLDRLQYDIDKLQRDIQKFDNDLQAAARAYENHPNWPSEAASLSAEVVDRYPIDPGVTRLKRNLRSYYWKLAGVKAGIVLMGIILLLILANLGINRFRAYQLSLTPTATPTMTLTPTVTFTPTPTITLTPTITPTPEPSSTPLPVSSIVQRDVWARSGCYEGFSAVGRIRAGGEVRFLPSDRRFDDFNRECALVEYQREGGDVIGWVLMMDLGSDAPPTATITP
jgi:tetratricopeptide (TPR) repeat protein